jgi:hypothetical protein
MDEPEVVQAAEVASAEEAAREESPSFFAKRWKRCLDTPARLREKGYPGLWAALVVSIIAVVGTILVNALPGQEWVAAHYHFYVSAAVICQALTYLGVIWLGALLAYWGIVKTRR